MNVYHGKFKKNVNFLQNLVLQNDIKKEGPLILKRPIVAKKQLKAKQKEENGI